MAKLVAFTNLLSFDLTLVNADCKGDDRTLTLGHSWVFGQYQQGVDIPERSEALAIRSADGGVEYHLQVIDDLLYVTGPGFAQKVAPAPGQTAGHGDTVELILDAGGLTWRDATIVGVVVPKLTYAQNGVPYLLHLDNLQTAGDAVDFIGPGRWTPTPGQYGAGIDIPECTSAGDWSSHRIRLAPESGNFVLSIYRIGYDIFSTFEADYPVQHVPMPGGCCQGDGQPKAVQVLSDREVRLTNTPSDVSDGEWANWPSPQHAEVVIHADVDLMTDYLQGDGQLTAAQSYVTRVEVRDQNNVILRDRTVGLNALAPVAVYINGKLCDVPASGAPPLVVTPNATGVITLSHRVNSLASPVFHLTLPGTSEVLDIDPSEKVTLRLAALQTNEDWLAQRTRKGEYVVTNRDIPDGAGQTFHQLIRTTSELPTAPRATMAAAAVGRGFAKPRATGAPPRPLNLTHFSGRQVFGFKFHDGQKVHLSGAAAVAHLDALRGVSAAATAGGDKRHVHEKPSWWSEVADWFSHAWDALVSFVCEVADGVMTFVVELADVVADFVVTTVSEVFDAVSWLLGKVFSLTLETVMEWIGSLFDWPAINRTITALHGHLASVTNPLGQGLELLETRVNAWLSGADWAAIRADPRRLDSAVSILAGRTLREADRDHHDATSSSPAVQWTSQAIANGDPPASAPPAPDLSSVFASLSGELDALKAILEKGFGSIDGDMTFSEIAQRVVDTANAALAETMQAFFRLLRALAEAAASALTALLAAPSPELPVVSALYRRYVSDVPTISNAELCVFLAAIPATVIAQAGTGRGPFDPLPQQAGAAVPAPAAAAADSVVAGKNPAPATLFGLGITVGALQLVSVCVTGVMEGLRIDRNPPAVKAVLVGKICVDSVAYALSVAAAGVYGKNEAELNPREIIDITLSTFQCVFRIKDVARWCTFEDPESAMWCGFVESFGGLVSLGLSIATVILQTDAGESDAARAAVPVKGVQFLSMSAAQLLSWPRELAFVATNENPEAAPLEGGIVLTRLALAFVTCAASCIRASRAFGATRLSLAVA